MASQVSRTNGLNESASPRPAIGAEGEQGPYPSDRFGSSVPERRRSACPGASADPLSEAFLDWSVHHSSLGIRRGGELGLRLLIDAVDALDKRSLSPCRCALSSYGSPAMSRRTAPPAGVEPLRIAGASSITLASTSARQGRQAAMACLKSRASTAKPHFAQLMRSCLSRQIAWKTHATPVTSP